MQPMSNQTGNSLSLSLYIYIYIRHRALVTMWSVPGPCRPRGVLLIVLRGSAPPVPRIPMIPGLRSIPVFRSKFALTFSVPKCRPRTPKINKNSVQNGSRHTKNTKFSKHEMLPKPLYLLWFDHIQPPLGNTLGIKNVLRRPHTDVASNFH